MIIKARIQEIFNKNTEQLICKPRHRSCSDNAVYSIDVMGPGDPGNHLI